MVLLLAEDHDYEREHRLRELLYASGIVSKSDEVQFTPPEKSQRTNWEERTFHAKSTYIRSRERHQIIKPAKNKNDPSQKLLVTPETNDSHKFRYWVRRSSSVEQQNRAMSWNNKGNELLSKGRYEEALQCYNNAIATEPYSSVSWNNKGAALHDMGKHHDAHKCYEMSLKMNDQNAIAWIGKGAVLHSIKKYEEAITCYDKAIEINPLLGDAWYNRGIVLKKLGFKERAEEDLTRAEEIEKTNL
ncbi:MAG: tetratricopeptide repeat protein [Nitrososphaerales archaeon]